MTCRRSQVRVLYRPPHPQTIRSGDFLWWAVQGSNRAALTTPVGRVSNQPSGLLLSPRFPTARNVYRDDCRFVVGGTGREQHVPSAAKAIKAPVQRRRPLPAAEAGRSCWGRVLIFQSPAKGLRKNQQTQPVALISARFPTRRNVYQERCRQTFGLGTFFVVDSTELEQQRRRPPPAAETGSRGWGRVLIFQSPAKGLRKNQQTQPVALISARFPTPRNVYQERCRQTIRSGGFFCGGRYRTRTAQPRRRRGSRTVLRQQIALNPEPFQGQWLKKGSGFLFGWDAWQCEGPFIFWYILPCRARRGRNIPSG